MSCDRELEHVLNPLDLAKNEFSGDSSYLEEFPTLCLTNEISTSARKTQPTVKESKHHFVEDITDVSITEGGRRMPPTLNVSFGSSTGGNTSHLSQIYQ